MKSSEILRKALGRMDGGRMWARGIELSDRRCSLESIGMAAKGGEDTNAAVRILKRAVGVRLIAYWNDSAPDFSVIQQGFEKAISLAEAEGD